MKHTNKYGLPEPFAQAVMKDDYEASGDISVTGLISPPQLRVLKKRYDEQIVEDVSEGIWKMIGQIGHKIAERAAGVNDLSEERLYAQWGTWKISAKPDLLSGNGEDLDDYKFTSVYAFLLGDKPEWEQQVNLYAWIYRQNGFHPKRARIIAVLRDWMKSRAKYEKDYPPCQALAVPIDLWSDADVCAFLDQRVTAHQQAEQLPDDQLPECTPQERWERPTTWAVKKTGNKKATVVCETLEAAEKACAGYGAGYVIEERKGLSVRCEDYCPVKKWCHQYKRMNPGVVVEMAAA